MAASRRSPRGGSDGSRRTPSGKSSRSGQSRSNQRSGASRGGNAGRSGGGKSGRTGGGKAGRSGAGKTGRTGDAPAAGRRVGRTGGGGKGRADRGAAPDRDSAQRRRRDLRGAAVNLPNWVVEDLARTTPNQRVADALEALGEASAAFSEGKYQKALRHAVRAKELAPRDATVREVLALAAYRTGDWKQALRELRTYRRFSGELTHIPIEMDTLRALGRDDEVPKAWALLRQHGAKPGVMKEGRVVYASHLIDQGEIAAAREVVAPGRLSDRPFEEDLRLWYVAARAAALDGDGDEARRLRNAILADDPSFPGIDELEALIAKLP